MAIPYPMNCNHDILSAQFFRLHDYWSGFQSAADTGIIIVLLG